MRLSTLVCVASAIALVGCGVDANGPEPVVASGEGYVIEGDLPAGVDLDAAVSQLSAGGFAVFADPATGEVATLISTSSPLARDANGEFSVAVAASCLDCGDPTCTVPSRTIAIDLSNDSGSSSDLYTVQSSGSTNFSAPITVPASFTVAVGNTVHLETTGVLPTCATFGHFFDVVGPDPIVPANPIISEYIEGSGSNKYIELMNLGGTDFDLAANGCSLRLYSNGAGAPSTTTAVAGNLAAGGVLVFQNSSASAFAGSATNNSAVNFNGDDGIDLFCNGAIVDIIGKIGERPIPAWGTSPSTLNTSLLRKCSVTTGDTNGLDDFDPVDEWVGFATDDVSDLGLPGCAI